MDSVHISGLAGAYAADAQPLTAREMERRLAGERNVTIHAEEEMAIVSFSRAPPFAATVAGTCAVLVGELHDVEELAASLGSDTQAEIPVLLAQAYHRCGEQLLEQLRGDFALVLWDSQAARGSTRSTYVRPATSSPLRRRSTCCNGFCPDAGRQMRSRS